MGHKGKCAHIHGHNYVVELTAAMIPPTPEEIPDIPEELISKEIGKSKPPIPEEPIPEPIPEFTGVNELGVVIDFSIIKERIGGWIDANWDHAIILHTDDHCMEAALAAFNSRNEAQGGGPGHAAQLVPNDITPDRLRIFRMDSNPTAENMAAFLLNIVGPQRLSTDIILIQVTVWETENCHATAAL
jgi:6-pyruvoyltetrahydropterin/6-carboxytetrahydropterin synthase